MLRGRFRDVFILPRLLEAVNSVAVCRLLHCSERQTSRQKAAESPVKGGLSFLLKPVFGGILLVFSFSMLIVSDLQKRGFAACFILWQRVGENFALYFAMSLCV